MLWRVSGGPSSPARLCHAFRKTSRISPVFPSPHQTEAIPLLKPVEAVSGAMHGVVDFYYWEQAK
jgi:hypothetical protein